ncbi:DUF5684 domain-containing protein [Microbacterium sp. 11MF]|uniref:DUF5684 domain-containing protein n=1 Tax=Microbacterium sp. 11MF TaxID=1169146 RepID=UPI0003A32B3D|nr:DUF5684 domain-containing protein [Microbacterium sp. 11MF]
MNTGVDSGAGVVLGLLSIILGLAVYVWVALALSAAFRKMGEESWHAWVPVLNVAVLLRWGGFSPWLALLVLVPGPGTVAVWVLIVVTIHRLNPGFGYGTGMTVVGALLFPVWVTIVGFGPAEWRGARPAHLRPASPSPAPSPLYPPLDSFSSEFGAPLPPPAFPAPAEPAPAVPRAGATPQPPASVAPEPWTPVAHDAPAVEQSAPDEAPLEQPDPTSPNPTFRSESPWREDVDEVSAVSPAPFPPNAARGGAVDPAADPGIISAVPGRDEAPVAWVRPAAVGADRDESDVFPELTDEVSAVAGSPAAGAPVAATSSVSAQERVRDEADVAPMDDELERTVVVRRGHARWELVLPDGATVPLSGDVVVLGRNPVADPAHPRAQLVAIADPTRTVSKTHARLERRGDTWRIVDLGSTNGILLPNLGADVEVEPGVDAEVADRFLLGDASIRLQRVDAGS